MTWKPPSSVGIAAVAWTASVAFAVGCVLGFGGAWWIRTKDLRTVEASAATERERTRADQERLRADGATEAMGEIERRVKNALDASDARSKELGGLVKAAAARPPAVIRVCPPGIGPGVPATGRDPAGASGPQSATATGLVRPGAGADPGAILDAAPLRALTDRADQVSADLRAVLAACRG